MYKNDNFYFLLSMLLVYIFFGKIVDVLAATKPSSRLFRIKTKVLFYTFVAPLMFALIVFFVGFTGSKTFRIIFGCGLILASIVKISSTKRVYLTSFEIAENSLIIYYLTPFLKSCSRQFKLTNISYIEVTNANWLIDYPAAVSIELGKESAEFQILDKKLKADVKSHINAANKIHPAVH